MTPSAALPPQTTGGQEFALALAGRGGSLAFGLLAQSLLAYLLLPEGRGVYALCVTSATLLGALFTLSAGRGAQYFVMAGPLSVAQSMTAALAVGAAGSGLAVALAVPLIQSGWGFFAKAEALTWYCALPLVPLVFTALTLELQLAGLRRFGRLALFLAWQHLTTAAGVLLFVWGLGWGVNGAILGLVGGHLAITAAGFWDLRRNCGLAWQFPPRAAGLRVIAYGLRYHAAHMIALLEPRMGIIILGVLAASEDIGLYAVATTFMFQLGVISHAAGAVLHPRVAADGGSRPALSALCLRATGLAVAAALLLASALAGPLVRLLFSADFLPMTPLLWIMAPGILAYALSGILATHCSGVNRPEICSWAAGLGLLVNLAAILLLYPLLDLRAAAWALTIGMLGQLAFLTAAFHRITQLSPAAVWLPRRGDAAYLRAAGRAAFSRAFRKRPAADGAA